jgi:hypothetical protein
MLQEIETLAQDNACQESLSDGELLALLGEARPHGFRYTMLLLDVQERAGKTNIDLQTLLDLSAALARVGVFTKIFLPSTFQKQLHKQRKRLSLDWIVLQWSDDNLSTLLKRRLAQFGKDTLASWCDPGCPSPDRRLICAAQGIPGGLIRKGNELLRCVGRNQRLLTARDLDKILGPPWTDEKSREPAN